MSTIEVRDEHNKRVLDILLSEESQRPVLLIKSSKPIKTYIELEKILKYIPGKFLENIGYKKVS